MDQLIYLDHAAATPLDERVLAAMTPYFTEQFYNPSSPYLPAKKVRDAYDSAKDTLAQAIGAKADELVMTAGATESINLAIGSATGHVIAPGIEHHAVLEAVRQKPHTLIQADERGFVSAAAVAAAITPETTLVTVALANNELGTVQPLRAISAVVAAERERRLTRGDTTPIYFHTDASQGVGQLDVNVARLGVDMLTLNAGKIYGPKQVGLLFASRRVQLTPVVVGGGQERGLRSGTENVAGVIGFAKALQIADGQRKSESKRLETLRDILQKSLTETIPSIVVSGHKKRRLSGHLHVSFPGLDGERLVFLLEARGVLVATGSACAANRGTQSHVLSCIRLSPGLIDGSLRLTLGHLSTEENIAQAAGIINEVVNAEYKRVGK